MSRSRWRSVAAALAVVAAVVIVLLQSAGEDGSTAPAGRGLSAASSTATPTAGTASAGPGTTLAAGLELVALDELPEEAAGTWALVMAGGPFPYRRDGVVFENRERLLPRRDRGDYREYTVPTPGEDDRGARRLVVSDEAVFYTADHYDSFVQVDVDP